MAPGHRFMLAGTAAALLLGACGRDARLPTGAAAPPGAPWAVVNPLCAGWQVYSPGLITTAVTLPASGSPYRVTSTIFLGTGGTLTIEPGTVLCFDGTVGVESTGGRLLAVGSASSPIRFTAYDSAAGWTGIRLEGVPPLGSKIRHAVVEYGGAGQAVIRSSGHLVFADTIVVRQSGAAVSLAGPPSRFGWSRVDTTTNPALPAITLGDSGRVEAFTIRGAAGTGLRIDGETGVRVMGGRIEGSGGTGIVAPGVEGIASVRIVRVVGGAGYPIDATPYTLQRLYGSTVQNQDSLKGNARDTVIMRSGQLNASLYVRAGLPWRVKGVVTVGEGGILRTQGTSRMVMDFGVSIHAFLGGRLQLRGTRTNPAVLTAADPAQGWSGIYLSGAPGTPSQIANARIEHVGLYWRAVTTFDQHAVHVDSAVFRQNGRALSLMTEGSRLTRSRVDTTLYAEGPAVELGADAILESTLVRGSASDGVWIRASTVQVQSCEVRGSVWNGIALYAAAPVHGCNLVGNTMGLWNTDAFTTVDATGNWWGDPGGPTAPGADGVTGGPVTYSPWLTAPAVLPYVP